MIKYADEEHLWENSYDDRGCYRQPLNMYTRAISITVQRGTQYVCYCSFEEVSLCAILSAAESDWGTSSCQID